MAARRAKRRCWMIGKSAAKRAGAKACGARERKRSFAIPSPDARTGKPVPAGRETAFWQHASWSRGDAKLMDVNWIDATGYAASALVFLTFYMQTMIPLRIIGILSNVAFMAYGFAGEIY